MSQIYSVHCTNNSAGASYVCLYQQGGNSQVQGVQTLAWLSHFCNSNTSCTFSWQVNYCFVYATTGPLATGVIFNTSATVQASSLSSNNEITLDYSTGTSTFNFSNQTTGTPAGNLFINQTANIPISPSSALGSVGIGMSGAATFAVQAEPGVELTFTPASTPVYWLTFGNYLPGEVLNTQELPGAVQVIFPPNIYTMYATLGANGVWTVSSHQS